MRRRTRENSAVQRPALVFPLIPIICKRTWGSKVAISVYPECVKRSETAQTRRKLCIPKRTASPQNSSTDILLSNPIVWPLPSLCQCTIVLLSWLLRKAESSTSHGNGLLKQGRSQDFRSTVVATSSPATRWWFR